MAGACQAARPKMTEVCPARNGAGEFERLDKRGRVFLRCLVPLRLAGVFS
jgi:hypothetical protein